MGNEALCRVEIGSETAEAKVLLETEELVVRGALRARIPFREMQNVAAADGILSLIWNGRPVCVHAGEAAAKWAQKIRNPKPVAEKLGIRGGERITVIGAVDLSFAGDADVSARLRTRSDLVFLAAESRDELNRLPAIRKSLAPAGAIWVIRPKGSTAISEADVMAAARQAGLVDVKVVKFSATHTAEKLVIPRSAR
jgi:hypothetical protein